jgi:SAM-dependent methyltransferase
VAEQQEVNLWELSDLCTPWCVHVAATLRIAEHIESGKEQITELAAAAGCDAYALHRVLSHLVSKSVFEEPAAGRFVLNQAARGLLEPSMRLGLDLQGLGGRMANVWSTLPAYVRTGATAYQDVFGMPFWEDLKAHPEIGAQFDELMGPAGHGAPNADFQITGGWEGVRTVVDVGGGTGAMLAEILRTRPQIRGTLVDFPQTVARSGEIFRAAGVADRVTIAGQSFFDPLPPHADIYLLKKVISNWPDPEAAAILRRCAEAARPEGRVVVLGGVTPDDEPRRISIDMLLVGGKHRSLSEFRELAQGVGLEVLAAEEQPSGYFVVECRTIMR